MSMCLILLVHKKYYYKLKQLFLYKASILQSENQINSNKRQLNAINVLLNKALRCIHYKKYNESVRNLKITKKN